MNAFLTSIGYQAWVLPVLLVIPILGAIAIWVHGASAGRSAGASPEAVSAEGTTLAAEATDARVRVDEVATGVAATPRMLAALTFAVEFVVSLGLWWAFDPVVGDPLHARPRRHRTDDGAPHDLHHGALVRRELDVHPHAGAQLLRTAPRAHHGDDRGLPQPRRLP